MAKSAIEKFISNYIRNKRISESEEGYEAWLRKNALDPLADFSDEVGLSHAESEQRSSRYGSESEALSDIGLSKSGYAKYLGESIENNKKKRLEKAIDRYIKSDVKNKSEHKAEKDRLEALRIAEEKKAEAERIKAEEKAEAERIKAEEKAEAERIKAEEKARQEAIKVAEKLESEARKEEAEKQKNFEKAQKSLYDQVKKGLEKSAFVDFDKAFSYATKMGLDEESARSLAKATSDAARNAAINSVTNSIISDRLTMSQAHRYALALGLSEEEATTLSEFAFKVNESVSDIVTHKNYLDNLREQIKQNQ